MKQDFNKIGMNERLTLDQINGLKPELAMSSFVVLPI